MRVIFLTDEEFRRLYWLFQNSRQGQTGTNTYGVSMQHWRELNIIMTRLENNTSNERRERELCKRRDAVRQAQQAMGIKG